MSILRKKLETERLSGKQQAFRERFHYTLEGWWGNLEVIPMGYHYHFRGDGTGVCIEYSGFAESEIPFEWRSVGDWVIEIKFDYSNYVRGIESIPYESLSDAAREAEDEWKRTLHDFLQNRSNQVEDDEDEWETVAYDFVAANVGYYWDVVLCEASIAERFRKDPKREKIPDLGLQGWDGALTRLQD